MNNLNGRRGTVQGNQKEKYTLDCMEIKQNANHECLSLCNVSTLQGILGQRKVGDHWQSKKIKGV